ncbi:hypothetical protein DSO57_1002417 [Entomophthora muscae]|uniref:Uncharacterized protein n=1 Tax=Entomophthora muscae TaxID=34485 RepID=A0ACC2SAP7_9FUNG|nr:hypothetical protein DSO57_1002417 [Entomophthora muscae]
MNTNNNNMRQAYNAMVASMDEAECNIFQKMLPSVCIGFLNQLWASDSQFCKQGCVAAVAGSERSTAPNSSAGDFPDEDSMFEEPLSVSSAPVVFGPWGQHPEGHGRQSL